SLGGAEPALVPTGARSPPLPQLKRLVGRFDLLRAARGRAAAQGPGDVGMRIGQVLRPGTRAPARLPALSRRSRDRTRHLWLARERLSARARSDAATRQRPRPAPLPLLLRRGEQLGAELLHREDHRLSARRDA